MAIIETLAELTKGQVYGNLEVFKKIFGDDAGEKLSKIKISRYTPRSRPAIILNIVPNTFIFRYRYSNLMDLAGWMRVTTRLGTTNASTVITNVAIFRLSNHTQFNNTGAVET